MLSNATLLRKYKITLADYLALLEAQNHQCAICLKIDDDTLVVDHCHSTGKVRGLLCHECNAGIGLVGDTRKAVWRAYRYLLKFEKGSKL